MPFNLGIAEIGLIVMSLGVVLVVVDRVARLIGRKGANREELEAEKRDLERRIEALEERDRLPRG